MSKSALIASVALYFAGRGATADRAVDQVTAIKSKAIQAIARARAAGRSGPEKADDRRDVSTQASAAATTLPRLQRAVSGEKFCEESGFSEDQCKSYDSAACECDWDGGQCWWQGGACGGGDDDGDDEVPTPGVCATSWTSIWDAGCETTQSGCPPVACDGDDERWCCNEGFEESCDEWHYCGGIDVGWKSAPALADLDNDGKRKPRPLIDELRSHVLCLSQATWTSWWAISMACSTTSRTPGRPRGRHFCLNDDSRIIA